MPPLAETMLSVALPEAAPPVRPLPAVTSVMTPVTSLSSIPPSRTSSSVEVIVEPLVTMPLLPMLRLPLRVRPAKVGVEVTVRCCPVLKASWVSVIESALIARLIFGLLALTPIWVLP